jgi:ATP-GRASP peptide maturase of grasp-with-spasm system
MILIFSIQNEISTSDVMLRLQHQGEQVLRINSDDDIYKLHKITPDGIYFENTREHKIYNLLEAKACWWRRTGISKRNFLNTPIRNEFTPEGYDLTSIAFGPRSLMHGETEDLRDYIFRRIYENCPVNIGNPWTFGLNKLTVMDIAKKHGLTVPTYEIVSNLNLIKDTNIPQEKFVTKAISNGVYTTIKNERFYSYTEMYSKEDFNDVDDVPVFPSLIMDIIDKKMEIRSFFLDGEFFSMAIFSQSNSQTNVDFRKYDSVRPNKTEPFKFPNHIEEKLRNVFKELNLNCGSVDIIINKDGEYVFLEINPVGQYGMTGIPCNYDLDNIIIKYLTHGTIR